MQPIRTTANNVNLVHRFQNIRQLIRTESTQKSYGQPLLKTLLVDATNILRWAYAHLTFITIPTFTQPARDIYVSTSQITVSTAQTAAHNNHSPVGLHPPHISTIPTFTQPARDIYVSANQITLSTAQTAADNNHSPVGLHPPHICYNSNIQPKQPETSMSQLLSLLFPLLKQQQQTTTILRWAYTHLAIYYTAQCPLNFDNIIS